MASHEPIHSGHFMTSNPHTEPVPDEEDEDVDVEVVDDDKVEAEVGGEGVKERPEEDRPITFYKFGPKKTQSIAIDVSLNKLNKCIKVAYNKMTTPKWKDFKGLRLHWKQRIRLNNVIWRAYYMEFRKPDNKKKFKKTPYCYFSVPDDDMTHSKIEGSLIEGMYWKRKMEAVCAQYKRWRHFMKNKRLKRRPLSGSGSGFHYGPPFLEGGGREPPKSQTPKNMSTDFDFDYDDLENVFTDTLFHSLNQPYVFPNPKESMQSGNADIMQPGLLGLQPSLEEIMASLEDVPSSDGEDPLAGMEPSPPPRQPAQQETRAERTSTASAPPMPPLQAPSPRDPRDYTAASMLVDYSNQVAARQASTAVSTMFMLSAASSTLSTSPAAYSTSTLYEPRTSQWKPQQSAFVVTGGDVVANVDTYVPQFLSSACKLASPSINSSQMTPQTRNSWWLDSASLQGSPLALTPPLRPSPATRPTVLLGAHDLGPPPAKQAVDLKPFLKPEWSLSNLVDSPPTRQADSLTKWKLQSSPLSADTLPQPLYPQVSAQLSDVSQSTSTASVVPKVERPERVERVERDTKPLREEPPAKVRGSRSAPADSTVPPVERKRILHLHAEQNRRTALKDGFDQLMEQVPDLYSGGVKPTNAVVLAKAADHIRSLQAAAVSARDRKADLHRQIQSLNAKIASLQSTLPSRPGASSSATSDTQAQVAQFFERYTREKTKQDWRFWLMAKMLAPLVESYASAMSGGEGASREETARVCRQWRREHWRLTELRPVASSTLVYLATNTNVLSEPASLAEHALQQALRPS